MPNVTYYVVVPFTPDNDGIVVPGGAKEAPNGATVQRRAASVATRAGNISVIAFQRAGDPDSGEFQEGVVLPAWARSTSTRCRG